MLECLLIQLEQDFCKADAFSAVVLQRELVALVREKRESQFLAFRLILL